MIKKTSHKSAFHNPKAGFTLIELVLSLGIFAVVFALLAQNLLATHNFKSRIRSAKELNSELSAVLGNGVAGLIRSGFGIRYEETETDHSQLDEEGIYSEGLQPEVDRLSVFTNSAHTSYFTLYREPYASEGERGDTARLMLAYSTGETYPLHTSEIVIEEFDVSAPADPASGGDPKLQPYVDLYIRARPRSLLGESPNPADEPFPTISYRTSYTPRNAR